MNKLLPLLCYSIVNVCVANEGLNSEIAAGRHEIVENSDFLQGWRRSTSLEKLELIDRAVFEWDGPVFVSWTKMLCIDTQETELLGVWYSEDGVRKIYEELNRLALDSVRNEIATSDICQLGCLSAAKSGFPYPLSKLLSDLNSNGLHSIVERLRFVSNNLSRDVGSDYAVFPLENEVTTLNDYFSSSESDNEE